MSLRRSVELHSVQRGGLEFGDLHDDAIDAQERAVRHLQNSGEPVLGSYLTPEQDLARAVQTELEVDPLESTVQPFYHGKLVDPMPGICGVAQRPATFSPLSTFITACDLGSGPAIFFHR